VSQNDFICRNAYIWIGICELEVYEKKDNTTGSNKCISMCLLIVSRKSVQRHIFVLTGMDIFDMVSLITVHVVLFVLMCVHIKIL